MRKRAMGLELTINKSDGVRNDKKKKSDGVTVHSEKKTNGVTAKKESYGVSVDHEKRAMR